MSQGTIILSFGCFFKWLRHQLSTKELELKLSSLLNQSQQHFGGNITGFEIGVGLHEISSWSHALKSNSCLPARVSGLSKEVQQQILTLPNNTIHLPHLRDLPFGAEHWFSECITNIWQATGISAFTIHPDQTHPDTWSKLLQNLPLAIELSVENMDRHKANYTTLAELRTLLTSFPRLTWTFDIAHWIGLGKSLEAEELRTFLDEYPPAKVHYSAITSSSAKLSTQETRGHLPVYGSGTQIPYCLIERLNCPFVLEGAIDIDEFDLMRNEINEVNRFFTKGRSLAA